MLMTYEDIVENLKKEMEKDGGYDGFSALDRGRALRSIFHLHGPSPSAVGMATHPL